MTYTEALRQRQIILEHLRRASTESDFDNQEYFADELNAIDDVVNTKWLELTCS